MRYSQYPSRAYTRFTALCEALCPLEYSLFHQFSRSQPNTKQPRLCTCERHLFLEKIFYSIYVKMICSYAVPKSKPANTFLHWHHKNIPNAQNCLQNQSLKGQMRVGQGACIPTTGFPPDRRKCWRQGEAHPPQECVIPTWISVTMA